jgi:uncharacterized membrane protein
LGYIVLQIEWGQVMEATCIYCTSLHIFPIARHPSIAPLLQFLSVGCEAPRFQVFRREARPTHHLSFFPIGMILFSPSMTYSLLYEPNYGSMMLGFYVFLRISTVYKCGVMVLCYDYKMFGIASNEMGILKFRIGFFLG